MLNPSALCSTLLPPSPEHEEEEEGAVDGVEELEVAESKGSCVKIISRDEVADKRTGSGP
jgi:hypothetical protein